MMATSRPAFRAPAPLANWLATKTRAERSFVVAFLLVVTIALLWAVAWQPLMRDTAALRIAQAGDASALAEARSMASEIGSIAPTRAPEPPADLRANHERILAQQNLRSAVTQLDWRDGRAHVVFAAVGYDALIVALEALQRDARLRAVAATLTARVEPGMVRAELTLAH
jgi:type II secretory pathway component PulM